MKVTDELIDFVKELGCNYVLDEPMSRHTTFKVGGNAKIIIEPNSLENIKNVVKFCNKNNLRYMAVGNGSNLLVSDNGIDAVVIILGKDFSSIKLIDENKIFVESGAMLTKLCKFALENDLAGLEFAYGIPGTCGGAAFMNGGAYGGEMKDVLVYCECVDNNGDVKIIKGDDMKLSYRHSVFQENGYIITGLCLELEKGNHDEIKDKMDDLLSRRKEKQPLEFASAGSTFKRPEGHFAGALIEQCGLKGASVGGAEVSVKHAGFVVNKGGATCSDILNLCEMIKNKVYNETGVTLEMEVKVTQ